MSQSIRGRRRNRPKIKARLRALDQEVLGRIRKSYLWSMGTWGGTRCGGCGVQVRPHWLCDLSGFLVDENNKVTGHVTAFDTACKYVKKCPGERDWMEDYANKQK